MGSSHAPPLFVAYDGKVPREVSQRAERVRLLKESPEAHGNLGRIMRAQRELARTIAELRPVMSDKAP